MSEIENDGDKAQPSKRFDASHTMDRLRDSLVFGVGQISDNKHMLEALQGIEKKEEVVDYAEYENVDHYQHYLEAQQGLNGDHSEVYSMSTKGTKLSIWWLQCLKQIPAILLIGMFHLMIGIPFGVSYFPIGWHESTVDLTNEGEEQDGVDGIFPIAGKDALGIRMFLLSTIIGQLAFTFSSGFNNPISLNMVENVPFLHALAQIVIAREGYGMRSLSTLMFMFALSSVIVGSVFYTLGKFELGRIIYFFPAHVLVGCIAGIGLFIVKTAIEVTMNKPFSIDALVETQNLLYVVLIYELLLRILETLNMKKDGKPFFSLLSPVYFCMITPTFYLVLKLSSFSVEDAEDAGYFFPQLDSNEASSFTSSSFIKEICSKSLLDIWTVVDFRNISWMAVYESLPTLFALSIFSLIHVPINIPAFSISSNQDVDINQELVAHGYSNIFSGLCGGLQNYMAYTQSILYAKSGGYGKGSGVTVAIISSILFLVGPFVASLIPRCMAGTLLLHVGIDLFLEGIFDTFGKFERLEYIGTVIITIVMTIYGMNAAMIVGAISAVLTYALQTVTYLDPIRGYMSAATLRSSKRNRNRECNEILDSEKTGRNNILVIQLQGHLFFGNSASLNQNIHTILNKKRLTFEMPVIVILDFSLVLGIDSSAAQGIIKLKKMMLEKFDVQLALFATGSQKEGFPCDYALSKELVSDINPKEDDQTEHSELSCGYFCNEETALLARSESKKCAMTKYSGSFVCNSVDVALVLAENALIHREKPSLLEKEYEVVQPRLDLPIEHEKELALLYLREICPSEAHAEDVGILFSKFQRKEYRKDDILWLQSSTSDCAMLLVRGTLIAQLEKEAGTSETVQVGRMVGELGLVQNSPRMSTVKCLSDVAVVYILYRSQWEELVATSPASARLVDVICITYLCNRVLHVSNRIFETKCLPI